MPTAHFFTEQNAFTTTADQSFGPVSDNVFNITTKLTNVNGKKAFAICKGVVLIQPQTGSSDKVNLILRPYKQPIDGLTIKYFVYRGLKKSDFFTGALIKDAGSDFVNKIRADFASFYSGSTPPPFTSKFIGFDDTATAPPATTLISDFFFKESVLVEAGNVFDENDDFELPMIDIGKWLGNFTDGDCGIDVVLDYGDYKQDFDNGEFVFDLTYAQSPFAKITLAGTETQKKLQREQSTQFIDIAAFYGMFVNEGEVKLTDTAAAVTSKKGNAIYNDLLTPFTNKNKWYLYIQSDRGRSYNYYNNYKIDNTTNTHNLKTGTTETTLVEAYYKEQDWPMIITSANQATGADNKNHLYLQLITDNNVNTALYAQVGMITNAQQNNFSNADYLRQLPDADGNYSGLTTNIHLSNPAESGVMIAGITLLLYQGVSYSFKMGTTTDENGTILDVMATPNFFDDTFDLIKAKPLLQLNADTQFSKMTSQRLNLINHYYDKKQQGISAVQTLVINDVIATESEATPPLQRVTYVTETVNLKANAASPTGTLTSDTKTSPSAGGTVAQSKTYSLPEPYYYNLKLFTDSTQTITGLELKSYDGTTPTKIILGLTKAENELLQDLITATTKNPRLFLIDLFENDNDLLSPENIKYQKYNAAIVAEKPDGKLELFKPAIDVMVYSLDRKYHFSKGYSEFVKELPGVSRNKKIELSI